MNKWRCLIDDTVCKFLPVWSDVSKHYIFLRSDEIFMTSWQFSALSLSPSANCIKTGDIFPFYPQNANGGVLCSIMQLGLTMKRWNVSRNVSIKRGWWCFVTRGAVTQQFVVQLHLSVTLFQQHVLDKVWLKAPVIPDFYIHQKWERTHILNAF